MKKSIITLLLAAISATTFAQTVTLQQAQQRAESFLKRETSPLTLSEEAYPQPFPQGKGVATAHKAPSLEGRAGGEAPYYIFNADDGQGFVIVSGDERAREI